MSCVEGTFEIAALAFYYKNSFYTKVTSMSVIISATKTSKNPNFKNNDDTKQHQGHK